MTRSLFKALMISAVLCSPFFAGAQGMSVNTTGSAADHSAMLDVVSTTQGMLVPRMTSAQRTGISLPAKGLLVFQTDGAAGFYYNSGTSASPVWLSLNAAGSLTGATLAASVVNANISTLSALTGNGLVATSGGTGALSVTSTTGSGSAVLASSPTLVTPALGTPSALVGTNISGLASSLSVGGNAGTATKLATARTINGTSFDGSGNITVTAAAGTLTGTTLPALDGSALTGIFPSQTGNSGKYLTTNGATTSWGTGGTIANITTSTSASPSNGVNTLVYCTVSGVSVILPTSPITGQIIYIFTDNNTGTINAGGIGIRQSNNTFPGVSNFSDIGLTSVTGKSLIYNGAYWMTF